MNYDYILKKAFIAMNNAYAIYSNYRVGCAILCKDKKVFIGANIENASYGATNCAERSAIFSLYSNGYHKDDIECIAIVSNGKTVASPCGICRQVLVELINSDTPIILSNKKDIIVTNISELLPLSFTSKDL